MNNDREEKIALSIPEAAKASGLSTSYLYKLSAEGKLPILKVGTQCLVPVDSFKEWLLEHVRKGGKRKEAAQKHRLDKRKAHSKTP